MSQNASALDQLQALNLQALKDHLTSNQPREDFNPFFSALNLALEEGYRYVRGAEYEQPFGVDGDADPFERGLRRTLLVATIRGFLVTEHTPLSNLFKQLAYLAWDTDAQRFPTNLIIGDLSVDPDKQNVILTLTEEELDLRMHDDANDHGSLTREEIAGHLVNILQHVAEFYAKNPGEAKD